MITKKPERLTKLSGVSGNINMLSRAAGETCFRPF